RPEKNHSFPGYWSLVAGKIEPGESPEEAARREIFEETAINVDAPLGKMDPLYVREGKTLFKVYPFHFDAGGQDVVLNEENEKYVWASVDEAKEMRTVTDTILMMSHFLL
ncbi:MAG: NUDIX domain-containing protein, partial [Candidatus Methanomethylophilaceae archaeon]|nr:NUDIX domain-containing protein [Candidatus Methanomethylophilaceae archaeon]